MTTLALSNSIEKPTAPIFTPYSKVKIYAITFLALSILAFIVSAFLLLHAQGILPLCFLPHFGVSAPAFLMGGSALISVTCLARLIKSMRQPPLAILPRMRDSGSTSVIVEASIDRSQSEDVRIQGLKAESKKSKDEEKVENLIQEKFGFFALLAFKHIKHTSETTLDDSIKALFSQLQQRLLNLSTDPQPCPESLLDALEKLSLNFEPVTDIAQAKLFSKAFNILFTSDDEFLNKTQKLNISKTIQNQKTHKDLCEILKGIQIRSQILLS